MSRGGVRVSNNITSCASPSTAPRRATGRSWRSSVSRGRQVSAPLGVYPLPPDRELFGAGEPVRLVRVGHQLPPRDRSPQGLLRDRGAGRYAPHAGEGYRPAPQPGRVAAPDASGHPGSPGPLDFLAAPVNAHAHVSCCSPGYFLLPPFLAGTSKWMWGPLQTFCPGGRVRSSRTLYPLPTALSLKLLI